VTSRRRTTYRRTLMMKDIRRYGGLMDDEEMRMKEMMIVE
jgi:hypothetical protein